MCGERRNFKKGIQTKGDNRKKTNKEDKYGIQGKSRITIDHNCRKQWNLRDSYRDSFVLVGASRSETSHAILRVARCKYVQFIYCTYFGIESHWLLKLGVSVLDKSRWLWIYLLRPSLSCFSQVRCVSYKDLKSRNNLLWHSKIDTVVGWYGHYILK